MLHVVRCKAASALLLVTDQPDQIFRMLHFPSGSCRSCRRWHCRSLFVSYCKSGRLARSRSRSRSHPPLLAGEDGRTSCNGSHCSRDDGTERNTCPEGEALQCARCAGIGICRWYCAFRVGLAVQRSCIFRSIGVSHKQRDL